MRPTAFLLFASLACFSFVLSEPVPSKEDKITLELDEDDTLREAFMARTKHFILREKKRFEQQRKVETEDFESDKELFKKAKKRFVRDVTEDIKEELPSTKDVEDKIKELGDGITDGVSLTKSVSLNDVK